MLWFDCEMSPCTHSGIVWEGWNLSDINESGQQALRLYRLVSFAHWLLFASWMWIMWPASLPLLPPFLSRFQLVFPTMTDCHTANKPSLLFPTIKGCFNAYFESKQLVWSAIFRVIRLKFPSCSGVFINTILDTFINSLSFHAFINKTGTRILPWWISER